MRIGLVVERFVPRLGGLEQWAARYARWLRKHGYGIDLITRQAEPSAVPPGAAVHLVSSGPSRVDFANAAQATCESLHFDIIHDSGCGWHGDVLHPHSGSPLASWERRLAMRGPISRWLGTRLTGFSRRRRDLRELAQRQFTAKRRAVIAISRMVQEDIVRLHGTDRRSIHLIPNGVDTEWFSPAHRAEHRERVRAALGVQDDELLLLLVAHNFRLKGGPELCRAVRRLRRQGFPVRAAIVGGGRTTGGSDRHSPIQFVAGAADVVPYYAAADLYVHPTHYDPCSLVVLEAMAMGLPVITTVHNGAGELIQSGREGFVIDDPRDITTLSSRIQELSVSKARAGMGQAARERSLQLTEDASFSQIVGLYHQLLDSRTRAAA